MAVTINNLRGDWRQTIKAYDDMITATEGQLVAPVTQDTALAAREWLEKLRTWRAELETLLLEYPEEV